MPEESLKKAMGTKLIKLIALSIVYASLAINLSSCGAVNREQSVISDRQLNPPKIGTSGQLISIQSDNVQAAGYDDDSLVMTVQFDNGALYEYYGVPADVWTSFVAAQPHPWSQVGYPRLVQAGIPYKRIG